jgi:hypothetical protein
MPLTALRNNQIMSGGNRWHALFLQYTIEGKIKLKIPQGDSRYDKGEQIA